MKHFYLCIFICCVGFTRGGFWSSSSLSISVCTLVDICCYNPTFLSSKIFSKIRMWMTIHRVRDHHRLSEILRSPQGNERTATLCEKRIQTCAEIFCKPLMKDFCMKNDYRKTKIFIHFMFLRVINFMKHVRDDVGGKLKFSAYRWIVLWILQRRDFWQRPENACRMAYYFVCPSLT